MNQFKDKVVAFFKNKNTVTILGVIVILALLYFGYSNRINSAVNPITVPVAAVTIPPRTLINEEYITSAEVPSIAVTTNVYTSINAVIGKYTNVNTMIPAGSMFYREAVVDSAEFRDTIFEELDEDQIPYLFSVDMESTYGNSIYPNTNVDIYMKAEDDGGRVIVGKLLEDALVLAVRDDKGDDVFADTSELKTPSYFVFGVTEDIHILLRKAKYIPSNSIELFPVPHGKIYKGDGEVRVSTEYLKDFINSKSVILEGQEGNVSADVDEETAKDITKTKEKNNAKDSEDTKTKE